MAQKRQQQSSERKRQILAAALTCFAEGGADAVTIEAVSRGAQASVGSIYHHFGNKDKLLLGLYLDAIENYRATIQEATQSADDLQAHVKAIVSTHICWVADNPVRARILHSQTRNPEVKAIQPQLRAGTSQFIRELWPPFKEAMRTCQIRQINPKVLPALIIGSAQELSRHFFAGHLSAEEIRGCSQSFADCAWYSLRNKI